MSSISEFWINIDDEPTIIFLRKVILLEEAYGSASGESRSDKKRKERDKSTTITVSNVRTSYGYHLNKCITRSREAKCLHDQYGDFKQDRFEL